MEISIAQWAMRLGKDFTFNFYSNAVDDGGNAAEPVVEFIMASISCSQLCDSVSLVSSESAMTSANAT